jgi:hypothetical protein
MLANVSLDDRRQIIAKLIEPLTGTGCFGGTLSGGQQIANRVAAAKRKRTV